MGRDLMGKLSDNISVAVVEDCTETREALTLLINDAPGFACVAACASAEAALETIPPLKPDVVLMDIGLPGMSGIDCIQRLKGRCPTTEILMLTVFEDYDRIFNSLKAGASGYLVKKTPPAKLLEAIADARQGGAPMSSQIARKVVDAFKGPAAEAAFDAVLSVATPLSQREQEILAELARGCLYKEVADKLGISIGTVRVHIRHIYEKLHVHNRTEAIRKAYPKDPPFPHLPSTQV